ncbi:MAG: alpha/beta hydrolase, partial [Lysobacterales bacterium]
MFAAPDLDASVAAQRMTAVQMGPGLGRFTMYFSPSDQAISLAERLFANPRGRLGQFDKKKLTKEQRGFETRVYKNAFIRFEGETTEGYGHSYFRTDPAVSSDIVL